MQMEEKDEWTRDWPEREGVTESPTKVAAPRHCDRSDRPAISSPLSSPSTRDGHPGLLPRTRMSPPCPLAAFLYHADDENLSVEVISVVR